MGRAGRGNRGIDLNGGIVPATLMDRGVHDEAAIYEGKSRFHGGGHNHTGGAQGAIIDLTRNLVSNSNFEHDITNASGVPDFWYASGDIETRVFNSGYIGTNALRIISNPPVFPSGIHSLYQPIPSPSGYSYASPPSGDDFSGRSYSFGIWASGVGELHLGHYDTIDYWSDVYSLEEEWQWCTYSYSVVSDASTMRVLVCVDGSIYIDNAQLNQGTRLFSNRPHNNETDLDSWRKQNNMFNNVDPDYHIWEGDVVVASPSSYAAVTLPRYAGQGGVLGVSIHNSASGNWIGVCNEGPAMVNVLGPVAFADTITAEYDPSYPGYSISSENIGDAIGPIDSEIHPFGIAMGNKSTSGPGQVLTYVNPPASKAGGRPMKAIHMAPEFPGAVEGALGTDDPGTIRKGNEGGHNYYVWNYDNRGEDFTISLDGVTGAFSSVDLKSDEVYQEALLVGEIRNKYGVQVDRIGVKILSSAVYEQAWVEAATDPGEMAGAYGASGLYSRPVGTFAAGGPAHVTRPVGPPADNEHSTERWPAYVGRMGDDGDHSKGGLPVGPIDGVVPSGWDHIGFDLRNGVLSGILSVSQSGTGILIPPGTASNTNSVITRLPVPNDYIGWRTSGVYIWNKAEAGASIDYVIYDTEGTMVASGVPTVNATWTQTLVDIPSGVFNPNEFFTMYSLFTSTGDNSAYIGEVSLYYHNYA